MNTTKSIKIKSVTNGGQLAHIKVTSHLLDWRQVMPAPQPARRTYTKPQERSHLVEDLIKENGEATW